MRKNISSINERVLCLIDSKESGNKKTPKSIKKRYNCLKIIISHKVGMNNNKKNKRGKNFILQIS